MQWYEYNERKHENRAWKPFHFHFQRSSLSTTIRWAIILDLHREHHTGHRERVVIVKAFMMQHNAFCTGCDRYYFHPPRVIQCDSWKKLHEFFSFSTFHRSMIQFSHSLTGMSNFVSCTSSFRLTEWPTLFLLGSTYALFFCNYNEHAPHKLGRWSTGQWKMLKIKFSVSQVSPSLANFRCGI